MKDDLGIVTRVSSFSIRRAAGRFLAGVALAASLVLPLSAARADEARDIESAFDRTFGTDLRAPRNVAVAYAAPATTQRTYASAFEAQIAQLASAHEGRIGVAAVDLRSGRSIAVLGDQPFPLASTSKIAIAATYLEMVDRGQARLTDLHPLMVPVPSRKFDGPVAPVRQGDYMSAQDLIELALTRSSNPATDALLAAVGGTGRVNDWLRRAGIADVRIDRDIATLVRDDGEVNPATTIDPRDSATPAAMVRLLSGLYQGQWLSPYSRAVLLGAMERCETGKRRIPALMPEGVRVAHKTGSLSNTSSDIGIIQAPDGRAVAMAIYVTGQAGKANREARIASIAKAIYDGYMADPQGYFRANSR